MEKFIKGFLWIGGALLGLAIIIATTGFIVSDLTFFNIIYKVLLIEIIIILYCSSFFMVLLVSLIFLDYVQDNWNKWFDRFIVAFFGLLIFPIYFTIFIYGIDFIYPEKLISNINFWYLFPLGVFVGEIITIIIIELGSFIWKKIK